MANWDNIQSRGTVTDRRGAKAIGGIGIVGLGIMLLFNYLSTGKVDVGQILSALQDTQVTQQQIDPKVFEGADEYEVFASTVLGSTTDTWSNLFSQSGKSYSPPHFVLFRGATDSGCGGASSYSGPHYCPTDDTIYLDETFFDELQNKFGASGDVAQAYVIAHEVGHHVQEVLAIENPDSIATELQADCFAGLWAGSLKGQNVFEPGEIKEALDAASAVGDDNIQKQTTGRINPETWTHGSSAERVQAFTRGYESGAFSSCVQ